jgi:hypothetical protein
MANLELSAESASNLTAIVSQELEGPAAHGAETTNANPYWAVRFQALGHSLAIG